MNLYDLSQKSKKKQQQLIKEHRLAEFAQGSGGGESGRWYTDDQMTDLVGDGWWQDMDVSGANIGVPDSEVPKAYMIQQAQRWLKRQGYSVQVLNCKANDDDMEWYIEGAFPKDLKEFAPPGGDEGGPDEDEILFRLAKQWWLGTESDMIRVERTLASMGWEIGEDEGSYDDGGVFVVRSGDENGRSYQSWPHEELVAEGVAEAIPLDTLRSTAGTRVKDEVSAKLKQNGPLGRDAEKAKQNGKPVKPGVAEGSANGMRLLAKYEEGQRAVKVYKNAEWNEYVVQYYDNGQRNPEADYHTDDKQDAIDSASSYLKKGTQDMAEGLGYSQDPDQAKWYHAGRKAYKFGTTGDLIQDIAKKHGCPPEWLKAFHAGYQDQEGWGKQDVEEAGYNHGFPDPNAPSLNRRRREDDEGHSEFDDRQRRQTGMIFYTVDDAERAQQLGLKQTRSGKWFLRTGNRLAQQVADKEFGMGRIWYPESTVEEAGVFGFMTPDQPKPVVKKPKLSLSQIRDLSKQEDEKVAKYVRTNDLPKNPDHMRVVHDDVELGELSNELLGRYKKELGVRASAADKAGDYDRGHEYFKKITKATIRQGDNDARRHAEKENDMMETRLNMMRKAGYDL